MPADVHGGTSLSVFPAQPDLEPEPIHVCRGLGIEVVDQPEPLQHQPLVDQLDDRRLGRDQPSQPASRDHARAFAQLFLDAATIPSTWAVKPKMMPACMLSAVVRPITLAGGLSST